MMSILRIQHSSKSLRLISRQISSAIANPLPASFLRGGTSKGLFINRLRLGEDAADWDALFLRLMGSPDPLYGRQLDGMGGGVSSLSKVMVVGPPSSAEACARGVDVEYTFAQIGIRDSVVDYTGNCGNLTSMVGVFGVYEGMCSPRIEQGTSRSGTVRTWNTNTNKEIRVTFPLSPDGSPALDLEQVSITGVPGKASEILLDFVDPAGARTGKLLPTGNATDSRQYDDNSTVTFSLVDATNPTVIISSDDLFGSPRLPSEDVYTQPELLERIERIRQDGARMMGLDPSAQAQPKLAIVGVPSEPGVDIDVHAFSMGVLHRAVPMTLGLCLGVAAMMEGTVVHNIAASPARDSGRRDQGLVRLRHPGGVVDVGAEFASDGSLASAKVVRTGRRLMQGTVWW